MKFNIIKGYILSLIGLAIISSSLIFFLYSAANFGFAEGSFDTLLASGVLFCIATVLGSNISNSGIRCFDEVEDEE